MPRDIPPPSLNLRKLRLFGLFAAAVAVAVVATGILSRERSNARLRDWTDAPAPAETALGHVSHVFTHFRLELAVVASDCPRGEGWWQPLDRLVDAGLPTLYRRAADSALEARSALAA